MPHGLRNDTGPSVRSSVCLFHLAPQPPRRAAGLLLWAREREISIYSGAGAQQMRAVSRL